MTELSVFKLTATDDNNLEENLINSFIPVELKENIFYYCYLLELLKNNIQNKQKNDSLNHNAAYKLLIHKISLVCKDWYKLVRTSDRLWENLRNTLGFSINLVNINPQKSLTPAAILYRNTVAPNNIYSKTSNPQAIKEDAEAIFLHETATDILRYEAANQNNLMRFHRIERREKISLGVNCSAILLAVALTVMAITLLVEKTKLSTPILFLLSLAACSISTLCSVGLNMGLAKIFGLVAQLFPKFETPYDEETSLLGHETKENQNLKLKRYRDHIFDRSSYDTSKQNSLYSIFTFPNESNNDRIELIDPATVNNENNEEERLHCSLLL